MEDLFAGALFAYEEEDEDVQPELRGIMAYSGSGRLYVVGDDGKIKAADVRQQLLSGAWAQQGSKAAPASGTTPPPPLSVRTITASPSLDLTASHLALNRSGTYAAVAGSALEDPEFSRVVVVDLTNCRPAPTNGSSGGGGSRGAGRHDVCEAVVLDEDLFASRPGLRVLQIGWHPDSDAHLAVLTSDNVWRLYNTQHAGLPEQTFELQLHSRRGLGLGAITREGSGRAAVAFAFGPPKLWQRFTVYFLTADGNVWALCPVVPYGCRYPSSMVDQLAASCDSSSSDCLGGGGTAAVLDSAANTEAWLQRAFQQMSTPHDPAFSSGMAASVAHALDEHVPALVGPLPVASADGSAQQQDGGSGGGCRSLVVGMAGGSDSAQALLMCRYAEACTALAVATASGFLGLHLLAGEAAPAWFESAPQCVLEGVELKAVRSQVGVMPALAGSSHPQLVLLDVVNLSLPENGSLTAAGGAGAGADSEDEAGAGGAGEGAPPLAVSLAQDPAAPELLYALHCSGIHAVTVTWLPLLAALLADGNGGGSGSAGPLPAELPPPSAELLLRSRAGVVAAASVGDVLSGTALAVLEADGKAQCLQPTRFLASDSSSSGGGGGEAAAAAEGSKGAAGGGGGGAGASSAAVHADVEAQLATIYGDLRRGPKPCELPRAAPGRPAGCGNPEGQRLLNEAAAALRASHVEYAHQAHADLLERLRQLRGEMDRQRQRAEGLERVAAAAEQAAEALDAKAARILQLQENLGERLQLLAELHWSLPRPASRAEQQFVGQQLPDYEAAAASLAEDSRALKARVASLQRKLRSMGAAAAGAAVAAVPVPPHQLRRVREALSEQEGQIAANRQRLAVLEEAVAAAAVLGS